MSDLELRRVSKSYAGVHALVEVDFTANKGEVHALLGENGAGKSTLIKVLSGAIHPDSGELFLFGKQLRLTSPTDAIKAGIATVYQELSLIPDLTVAQNIFFDRKDAQTRFGTYSKRSLRLRTLELLDRVGICELDPDARICDVSLAKRQEVEILKAISRNPDVIILDEATSALSENRVQWMLDLARVLANEGKIVIFISHRMSEILRSCDRITVFRNGKNVSEVGISEANMDDLVSSMLGRRLAGYFPEKRDTQKGDVVLDVSDFHSGRHLHGVNLNLRSGEILGVGGLAGQGQLSLFLGLFGVQKSRGAIRIKGRQVSLRSPRDSMRNGMTMIPEDRSTQGLILPYPIGYNITLSLIDRLKRGLLLSRRKEKEVVDSFMRRLEIKAEGSSTPVMNLSGGNQQKVLLAKNLAFNPGILLMYDITRGVDVGTKKEIFKLIREQAEKGNAILFYSTDMDELINVCDEVVVMHDGKIGERLGGERLTKENMMIESMGVSICE